jgi:hypothetical protein
MVSLFLTLALYGGEWSVSCPDCFIPKERTSSTNFIGGWVSPLASLDTVKRKIPCLYQELNSEHPACSLSLYRLSCVHHNDNQCVCVHIYIYLPCYAKAWWLTCWDEKYLLPNHAVTVDTVTDIALTVRIPVTVALHSVALILLLNWGGGGYLITRSLSRLSAYGISGYNKKWYIQ